MDIDIPWNIKLNFGEKISGHGFKEGRIKILNILWKLFNFLKDRWYTRPIHIVIEGFQVNKKELIMDLFSFIRFLNEDTFETVKDE